MLSLQCLRDYETNMAGNNRKTATRNKERTEIYEILTSGRVAVRTAIILSSSMCRVGIGNLCTVDHIRAGQM